MDRLDLAGGCAALPPFIEALNNWYIRRSRERFWKSEQDDDKRAAYDTLYTVLVTMCRTMAPFLPYLTEHIHRALCDGESVHLQDWPDLESFAPFTDSAGKRHRTMYAETGHAGLTGSDVGLRLTTDQDVQLVARMDLARAAVSAAAAIRTSQNLRNRLPLRKLTVAHPKHEMLEPLHNVIAEEANVKEVVFADDPAAYGSEVLALNPRVLGKRLGKAMQGVLAAAKAGEWNPVGGGAVEVAGEVIQADEYELRFRAAEGLDAVSFDGSAGVVVLDTTVDEELEREGLARDFIRLVQLARKDAGFNVADRIRLEVKAGTAANDAIAAHLDTVKRETLAVSYDAVEAPAGFVSEAKLADEPIAIGVAVAG